MVKKKKISKNNNLKRSSKKSTINSPRGVFNWHVILVIAVLVGLVVAVGLVYFLGSDASNEALSGDAKRFSARTQSISTTNSPLTPPPLPSIYHWVSDSSYQKRLQSASLGKTTQQTGFSLTTVDLVCSGNDRVISTIVSNELTHSSGLPTEWDDIVGLTIGCGDPNTNVEHSGLALSSNEDYDYDLAIFRSGVPVEVVHPWGDTGSDQNEIYYGNSHRIDWSDEPGPSDSTFQGGFRKLRSKSSPSQYSLDFIMGLDALIIDYNVKLRHLQLVQMGKWLTLLQVIVNHH